MIPDGINGQDLLAKSPTGSGKTLAFAVPIVQRLDASSRRPSALVLVPTRELAVQVAEEFATIASARKLQVAAVYGGQPIPAQAKKAKDAHILIATPGRLQDLVERKLVHRRTFHQWPIGEGRPDGGSFDEAGFYWTALFDGGRVARLSPAGKVVEEVALPVSRPTMIVFGGDDRRTAFITSARVKGEPKSGGVFWFRVDVPGVPEWPFARSER